MCISATALSLPNGDSIQVTDECTMKWGEQQHYVAHSTAERTAVFTANCQSERGEKGTSTSS